MQGLGSVTVEELSSEFRRHCHTPEVESLLQNLRSREIDLREFCRRARMLVGPEALVATVRALQERRRANSGQAPSSAASAVPAVARATSAPEPRTAPPTTDLAASASAASASAAASTTAHPLPLSAPTAGVARSPASGPVHMMSHTELANAEARARDAALARISRAPPEAPVSRASSSGTAPPALPQPAGMDGSTHAPKMQFPPAMQLAPLPTAAGTNSSAAGSAAGPPVPRSVSSATAATLATSKGEGHAGTKTLIHALLCPRRAEDGRKCQFEGCQTMKVVLGRVENHTKKCPISNLPGGQADCTTCNKWQSMIKLREHYRRKLISYMQSEYNIPRDAPPGGQARAPPVDGLLPPRVTSGLSSAHIAAGASQPAALQPSLVVRTPSLADQFQSMKAPPRPPESAPKKGGKNAGGKGAKQPAAPSASGSKRDVILKSLPPAPSGGGGGSSSRHTGEGLGGAGGVPGRTFPPLLPDGFTKQDNLLDDLCEALDDKEARLFDEPLKMPWARHNEPPALPMDLGGTPKRSHADTISGFGGGGAPLLPLDDDELAGPPSFFAGASLDSLPPLPGEGGAFSIPFPPTFTAPPPPKGGAAGGGGGAAAAAPSAAKQRTKKQRVDGGGSGASSSKPAATAKSKSGRTLKPSAAAKNAAAAAEAESEAESEVSAASDGSAKVFEEIVREERFMKIIERGASFRIRTDEQQRLADNDDVKVGMHVAVDLDRLRPENGGVVETDPQGAIQTRARPERTNLGHVTAIHPDFTCDVRLVCACAAGGAENPFSTDDEAKSTLGLEACQHCAPGADLLRVAPTQRQIVCSGCMHVNLPMALPQLWCSGCGKQIKTGQHYHKDTGQRLSIKLCKACYEGLPHDQPELLPDVELDQQNFETELWNAKEQLEYDHMVQCEGGCHRWYHYVCARYPDHVPLPPEWGLEAQKFVCDNCLLLGANLDESNKLVALQCRRAAGLRKFPLSTAVEDYVSETLQKKGVAVHGLTVRLVSSKRFQFRAVPAMKERYGPDYPDDFPYDSRVLCAFQQIDDHDICIFAMYVQEYGPSCPQPNTNRTYISYLDSVRYLRSEPSGQRSVVYHAIINGYLKHARDRGFERAHIWVAPPQQGDEYVFHCHPADPKHGVRPMGMSKLRDWYMAMLDRAVDDHIVTSYEDIQDHVSQLTSIREFPLFDGDFFPDHLRTMLAPPPPAARGPPALCRETSHALVQQMKHKTKSMRKRFLVANLNMQAAPPTGRGKPAEEADDDVELSNELVDKRMDLLRLCTDRHWQFNEERRAHYSTMMMLACIGGPPDAHRDIGETA